MNQKIEIKSNGQTLFNGKVLDIPIKEASIIEKSIEIFDDDDPCIIHRSFVNKQLVDELLNVLRGFKSNEVNGLDIQDKINFIDVPMDTAVFYIGG